ncbi:MAG: hypothetical protein ABIH66_03310 [bacterium]
MNRKSGINPLCSRQLQTLLLILLVTTAPGCLLRRGKPAAPAVAPTAQPDTSATRELRATGGEAATDEPADAATETVKTPEELAEEKRLALMKETGFDMINPNFSKNIGRKDPFAPVPISMAPFEWLKKMAPDRYRLVATARSFKGTFALIEMGDDSMVVQKGDTLKGDMTVLEINVSDVVFEQNGQEKVLGMKVRERRPTKEEEHRVGKLPNLNDWWQEYLQNKYEATQEGAEPEKKDFSDFVTGKEKGFFEKE